MTRVSLTVVPDDGCDGRELLSSQSTGCFSVSKPVTAGYQKGVPEPCAAVFLDRDGTLIEEKTYLSRPDEVTLMPGVGAALRRLTDAGFQLVIITNQSGIGRGFFTQGDMEAVNRRLAELVKPQGVEFAKIYFAPEAPDQASHGRKPKPEFLYDARDELGIVLERSYMIGDKKSDLECGWNAGVRQSILVRTGYGAEEARRLGADARRAVVVEDLNAAAEWILHYQQAGS